MGVFEEVTLTWKGEEFKIPPERMLRVIAQIEDVLTFGELAEASLGRWKLAKLSQAFGVALRAAGASVSDDEVFAGMFGEKRENASKVRDRVYQSVFTLQSLMIPPEHLRDGDGKKPEAAGSRRAASSPRATGSSSVKVG